MSTDPTAPTPATAHGGPLAGRLPAVVWSLALVVLVVLTSAVVVADGPLPGEVTLIRWLQRPGGPVPAVADAVRFVTATEGNLVLAAVPAVWLVRWYGRRGVASVAICLFAMLVVQPVSKEVVDRDRPSSAEVEVRAAHSSRSYPSGHALSTTTVWGTAAVLLARSDHRRWAVVVALPILVTGVASGVQGVHWASDTVAGTIIGAGAAWWAVRVLGAGPPLTR